MKIKDPYTTIKEYLDKVSLTQRSAFISALAAGICAHLYQFTNKLFNYDELYHTPEGTGEGLALGRWGLYYIGTIVKHFFGNYSLPLVNGLVTLLFIAVSACIIVYVLKMEDPVYAGIAGALCSVFPAVTCTYFFMYTAPYYGLALLLACISVMLIRNKLNILNFVVSVLLLTLSTGIYQAYFPVAVVLFVSAYICTIIREDLDLSLMIKSFLYLPASLVLYLVINKAAVSLHSVDMPDYQGLDTMGRINPVFILTRGLQSYMHTVHLAYTDVYKLNPTVFTRVTLLVLIILFVYVIIKTVVYKVKKARVKDAVFLLILVFIYPAAMFLIFLMVTPDTYMYPIMMYAVIFAFIGPVAMLDSFMSGDENNAGVAYAGLIKWISMGLAFVSVLIYIWFANINYQAMQYTNYHDLAYYMALMTQIRSAEGYDPSVPVIFLGEPGDDPSAAAGQLIDDSLNISGRAVSNVGAYSYVSLITKYLGFTPEFLWSDESEEEYETKQEVIDMPAYPREGSIRMVDDVLVVKFSSF